MQILKTWIPDELIFFIIWGCLFCSVGWKLLHAPSNVPRRRSILETTNSSSKRSSKDQANARNLPCAQESQFGREERSNSNFKIIIRLPEKVLKIVLKYIEKLLLTILINVYKNIQKYCHVSAQVESVERLRNLLNKSSNNRINVTMNNQSNYNVLNEETPNKQSSINEKTSPTNKISFHEYLTRFLYKDIDQSQEKFNNDVTSEENSSDVAGKQREKYAENVYERKNEDVTGNDNDLPSHKFGSCSKAARYNVDDNSARSNMKINENAESLLIRSLAEMFLASILRDSEVFGPESKEMEENEETKENSDTYLFDDESRSEMLADKLEEHLTFAEESDKICSRTEDDYPGEQSGVVPEKEVNLLENESVMHSSKGATQFPVEKKEKGEEFGSPPDTNSLKNCRDSESAGFSDLSPVTDHGKEEEDLNALVRRMIIVELKKHRKKEEIVLKRAHSDTETVIPRKKQNSKSRSVQPQRPHVFPRFIGTGRKSP